MSNAKISVQNSETHRRPRPQTVDAETRATEQLMADFEREYRRALDTGGSVEYALAAVQVLVRNELGKTEEGRRHLIESDIKLQIASDGLRVASMLRRIVTPDAAQQWLAKPNVLLEGEAPHDVIQRGQAERVVEILASVEEGIFV